MKLFTRAAADGIVCGAATVRSYEGRVLEHRAGYSINWGTGAGMILFSRPAAEIVLRQYSKLNPSTGSINNFYSRLFRVELNLRPQDDTGQLVAKDARLTLDWGYTPMLYLHGFASVGSIPNLACDLELPPGHFLRRDYVGPDRNNAGVVRCRSIANLPQQQ
jgi:hypothetical protein